MSTLGRGVAAALRTGGVLLLHDEHPAGACLDAFGRWREDYFARPVLGEVVTAVAGAGLALRGLEEWPGKDRRCRATSCSPPRSPTLRKACADGDNSRMGISVSILLIAVGAILTWGVTAEAEGLDVNAIGVILMIVGLLGLVISMIFWSSWGGFQRRTAYVEGGPVRPPRRRRDRGRRGIEHVAPVRRLLRDRLAPRSNERPRSPAT